MLLLTEQNTRAFFAECFWLLRLTVSVASNVATGVVGELNY